MFTATSSGILFYCSVQRLAIATTQVLTFHYMAGLSATRWLDVLEEPSGFFFHGIDDQEPFAVLDSNAVRTRSGTKQMAAAWTALGGVLQREHNVALQLPPTPTSFMLGSRLWDTTAVLNRNQRTEPSRCNVTFGRATALALYSHRIHELLRVVATMKHGTWAATRFVWVHGTAGGDLRIPQIEQGMEHAAQRIVVQQELSKYPRQIGRFDYDLLFRPVAAALRQPLLLQLPARATRAIRPPSLRLLSRQREPHTRRDDAMRVITDAPLASGRAGSWARSGVTPCTHLRTWQCNRLPRSGAGCGRRRSLPVFMAIGSQCSSSLPQDRLRQRTTTTHNTLMQLRLPRIV